MSGIMDSFHIGLTKFLHGSVVEISKLSVTLEKANEENGNGTEI
ncbi:hypothetical protein [Bacillus cereus]|nr:hypothetical protein [Bacillus cereus]